MIKVSVRKLKRKTKKLIRRVSELVKKIPLTYRGEIVAQIIPEEKPPHDNPQGGWNQLELMANEIGAQWPVGVTSVEAVADVRREFDERNQDQSMIS